MRRDPGRAPNTRERVLRAGLELWGELPPAELFSGLNVSSLSKAAGITRATFYTYWSTTQEYLDDLVDYTTEPKPDGYEPEVVDLMRQMALGEGDVHRDYDAAAQWQIRAVIADPGLRVRLGLLAKLDDPVVAEKLREHLDETEARAVEAAQLMLSRWGREARPPVTLGQLTALYSTFMDAFAARHLLEPDKVPVELYSWVAFALLITLTRPADDPADLHTVAALMNRFPIDGDRIRALRTAAEAPHLAVSLDEGRVKSPLEIVQIARALTSERPWQDLPVAEVAEASGVAESEVLRMFGSKHGLGVGVVQLLGAEELDSLGAISDPVERLRAMFSRFAEVLRRSPGLVQSAVLVFAGWSDGPGADVVSWAVTPSVVEAVTEAQQRGQLHPGVEPSELAGTLLRVLLTQLPLTYTRGIRNIDAVELLLRGAGAAPPTDEATPPT